MTGQDRTLILVGIRELWAKGGVERGRFRRCDYTAEDYAFFDHDAEPHAAMSGSVVVKKPSRRPSSTAAHEVSIS